MKRIYILLTLLLTIVVNSQVFDWDARTGSLIDKVSGTQGTATAVTFERTDKGLAGSFNGTSSKIIYASSFNIGNPNSVEAWFKIDGLTGDEQTIIESLTTAFYIGIVNNGQIMIQFYDAISIFSNYTGAGIIEIGKWYHLVHTFDGNSDGKIYLNGILIKQDSDDDVITSRVLTDFTISERALGKWLNGNIAKVKIHDKVLTQSEINDAYYEFYNSTATIETNYPKHLNEYPTDLSYEDGLVAAYNMRPQNGVVTDISGNGNTGTVYGASSTARGMYFNGSGNYVDIPNFTLTDFTIHVKFNMNITEVMILGDASSSDWILVHSSTNRVYFKAANGTQVLWSTVLPVVGKDYTFTLTKSGTSAKLWVNGIYISEQVMASDYVFSCEVISAGYGSTGWVNGTIDEVWIYDEVISDERIINWHNSFADNLYLKETFADEGIGDALPLHWIKGTGVYELKEMTSDDAVISELKAGTKYLECTSAGTMAIQNKQAYGTWEFYWYSGGASNFTVIYFVGDELGDYNTNAGYLAYMNPDEQVYLKKSDGIGEVTTLFYTTTSYIENFIWYKIKIVRTSAGQFSTYVKGGVFGSTYVLIDVTGGTGTNPVTDNTYTSSNYFVLDFDVGDRIANIEIFEGIEQ